jgi:hypothetical protein
MEASNAEQYLQEMIVGKADGKLYYLSHNDETHNKISNTISIVANRPENRTKNSIAKLGVPKSDAHRAAMRHSKSDSHRAAISAGKKGKKQSESHTAAIVAAKLKRKQSKC